MILDSENELLDLSWAGDSYINHGKVVLAYSYDREVDICRFARSCHGVTSEVADGLLRHTMSDLCLPMTYGTTPGHRERRKGVPGPILPINTVKVRETVKSQRFGRQGRTSALKAGGLMHRFHFGTARPKRLP